jgi:cbb3-type cytochrome oxidase maturation protein
MAFQPPAHADGRLLHQGVVHMAFAYIVVFATALGLTAVWALFWAFRSGQMDDFRAGARSIFDEDEPVGTVTDHFPTGERDPCHRGAIQ